MALQTCGEGNKNVDFTATQGVFGTLAYMAPEQIEGKETTKLADIYALGLIIFEMVTGQHAFPADTPLASAARRLSDSIESPKQFAPQLSTNWEQAIIRCLNREPSARFYSAMDVTKALSDQASDAAIAPQPCAYPTSGRLAASGPFHFGAALDTQHLPANWSSTANANAVLQFTMRDALHAVDDLVGQGSDATLRYPVARHTK